jgi:hypothetical protein
LWIEDHWDDDLLTSVQNNGCDGPFAWMLAPDEPALAIFGYYNDPKVVNTAQFLAESSGFPVVIRPACDNPTLTLLCAISFDLYSMLIIYPELGTLIHLTGLLSLELPGTAPKTEVMVITKMKPCPRVVIFQGSLEAAGETTTTPMARNPMERISRWQRTAQQIQARQLLKASMQAGAEAGTIVGVLQ